ncbi:MAG TPA: hypothetical protein GYA08_18610 [Chloroflexi bacterium]|nr:hypothetical protein [Chloroflexota bacterium]
MLTRDNKQLLWGALLIALGGFFLLQVSGILGALSDLFWSLAFGAAGAAFLYVFLTGLHTRWWAAIPGFTLLGLAATVFYSRFAPPMLSGMTGAIFLGSIGAGFLAIFVTNPRQWWAIIPGGALFSVAGVAAVDAMPFRFINPASVLFIGLSVTFGVLGLLSTYLGQNLRWAYIPAAILLVLGLVVVTPFVGALAWLWPLALIGAGAYLILRRPATSRVITPSAAPSVSDKPVMSSGMNGNFAAVDATSTPGATDETECTPTLR